MFPSPVRRRSALIATRSRNFGRFQQRSGGRTPDNPNIRLIKVMPEEAEYWDTPGNFISGLKVAFALVKGTYPNHDGEHRKVAL